MRVTAFVSSTGVCAQFWTLWHIFDCARFNTFWEDTQPKPTWGAFNVYNVLRQRDSKFSSTVFFHPRATPFWSIGFRISPLITPEVCKSRPPGNKILVTVSSPGWYIFILHVFETVFVFCYCQCIGPILFVFFMNRFGVQKLTQETTGIWYSYLTLIYFDSLPIYLTYKYK